MRSRLGTLSAGLALVVATVGPPVRPTRADPPPPSEWPVVRNAQTLRQREWRVGLWGFEGGATDWLQVGSLWAPWAAAAPNVHLKSRVLHHGRWSLALDASFLMLDFDHLAWFGYDGLSGRLFVVPVGLAVDAQVHPRLLTGLSATYAAVHSTPSLDTNEAAGTAAYDTFTASGHLTARLGAHWWLVTEVDWILFQGLVAVGDVQGQPDPFTTVTGSASATADAIAPGRGGSVAVSAVYRGGPFGLRFGAGYGDWVVPQLRMAVPKAIPFLLFDVYARFGGGRARETLSEGEVMAVIRGSSPSKPGPAVSARARRRAP